MTVKSELLDLQRSSKDKILRAESVVSFARKNPKSDLHGEFTWDDSVAAHQHRLWEARQLIQIVLVDDRRDPLFVSLRVDRSKPGGGYRSIDSVLSSRKLAELMYRDALADLQVVRERYDRVRKLVSVWQIVDGLSKKQKHGKRKGKRGGDREAA